MKKPTKHDPEMLTRKQLLKLEREKIRKALRKFRKFKIYRTNTKENNIFDLGYNKGIYEIYQAMDNYLKEKE